MFRLKFWDLLYLVETVLGWGKDWRQSEKKCLSQNWPHGQHQQEFCRVAATQLSLQWKEKWKWIYWILDDTVYTATTSSEWVSSLPRGKLLNIKTNQHNVVIAENYIQLCSFIFRSEMYLLLTSHSGSRLWDKAFPSSVRQRERKLFLLFCHHSSHPTCVGSWVFISLVM